MDIRDEKNIFITASPKELRDLANKMEESFLKAKVGDSTFVAVLGEGRDFRIVLHFNQEEVVALGRNEDPHDGFYYLSKPN